MLNLTVDKLKLISEKKRAYLDIEICLENT